MVDHLGGNLQSEPCIHTYMKAHMYMLQTRAQHYQFETALVTLWKCMDVICWQKS